MNKSKIKSRLSNYELLRIVSMLLIIFYHTKLYGQIIQRSENPTISIIMFFLGIFTIVHVNSFILVTGYFQSEKKFKMSKLWSLINASWFYRVVIMIILGGVGLVSFSKLDIITQSALLTSGDHLWYVKVFILLYCVSPFLNKFISYMDKKTYMKLLGVLFFIFCIMPFISCNSLFENDGFTLYNFVFLYLLGGFLKKYPIEKSYLFKRYSKSLLQVICIFVFFSVAFINGSIYLVMYLFKNVNSVFNYVQQHVSYSTFYYSNPLVVIQTLSYFVFFGTLSFKSNIINRISSLTFGIYLIHENTYLRPFIYLWTGVLSTPVKSIWYIPYLFLVTIVIFVVCGVIEFVRQWIFKFIYNRKISKILRDRFNNWVDSIKISSWTRDSY